MLLLKDLIGPLDQWGGIVELFGEEGTGKTATALYLAHQLSSPTHPTTTLLDATHSFSDYQHAWVHRLPLTHFLTSHLPAAFAALDEGSNRVIIVDALPGFCGPTDEAQDDKYLARVLTQQLRKGLPWILSRRLVIIFVNHTHFMPDGLGGANQYTPGGKLLKQLTCLRLECLSADIPPTGPQVPSVRGTLRRNTLTGITGRIHCTLH
jgi:RecA/RadA recombinase